MYNQILSTAPLSPIAHCPLRTGARDWSRGLVPNPRSWPSRPPESNNNEAVIDQAAVMILGVGIRGHGFTACRESP